MQRAEAKASFCIATGIAPSEYDGLTGYERDAIVREHNKKIEAQNAAQRKRR